MQLEHRAPGMPTDSPGCSVCCPVTQRGLTADLVMGVCAAVPNLSCTLQLTWWLCSIPNTDAAILLLGVWEQDAEQGLGWLVIHSAVYGCKPLMMVGDHRAVIFFLASSVFHHLFQSLGKIRIVRSSPANSFGPFSCRHSKYFAS